MKLVKLFPALKRSYVGIPFKVDVDDSFVDIDDDTTVRVHLGYQVDDNSASIPSTDLPGRVVFGPWKSVAPLIRHITPTLPGLYTLFVEAFFNVTPPFSAVRPPLPVVYQGVTVQAIP